MPSPELATPSCSERVCALLLPLFPRRAQSGMLLTWGRGGGGQLGHTGEDDEGLPRIVKELELEHIVEAVYGGSAKPELGVLLVRNNQGVVRSCGCAKNGRLGRQPADKGAKGAKGSGAWGVVQLGEEAAVGVAASDHHALAVARSGRLYAWGSNKRGQLGLRGTDMELSEPSPLLGELQHVLVASAACSNDATLVLDVEGGAYALRNERTTRLVLPARATAVYGGGGTLGVLLAPGAPAGAGAGAGRSEPPSASMTQQLHGTSAELAAMLASSCDGASVEQLQQELLLLRARLGAEERKAAVLRERKSQRARRGPRSIWGDDDVEPVATPGHLSSAVASLPPEHT